MENKTYNDPKTKNHDISSQNTNKLNRLIHEKSPTYCNMPIIQRLVSMGSRSVSESTA